MPTPETIQLIGIILMFVFLALSIIDPFYGLLSYFTAMMTRVGLYYPALAAARIELIVALIVLIEIVARGNNSYRIKLTANPVNKYMFLLFIVILASFAQAWDYEISWNIGVLEFIKIYIFFIMILCLVKDQVQLVRFLWTFVLLTMIVGYEGLYGYFSGQSTYVFQDVAVSIASLGFASGHVAAANMQLQCLPIMIYLTMNSKALVGKIGGAVLSGLSIVTIVASGSRGGFAGLMLTAALIVYFSKRRLAALAVCVLVVILSVPFMSASYISWMQSVVGGSDDSATSRTIGLVNGIEMMERRPILGVGPECYPLARKAWFGWGLEAHNHYGQLMGDLGMAGTIVWGFFLYYVFANLLRAKKNISDQSQDRRSLFSAVMGVEISLFVRLFEGWGSHSLYLFYWYMIAALSVIILELSEKKKIETQVLSTKQVTG
jgi:O-antigen ligase